MAKKKEIKVRKYICHTGQLNLSNNISVWMRIEEDAETGKAVSGKFKVIDFKTGEYKDIPFEV